MTSKTTASVISWVEWADDAADVTFEQAAIDRAKSMFTKVADHDWFYHDVTADRDGDEPAVVPFTSDTGQRRVEHRLSQTAKRRQKQLAKVCELVDDSSTSEAAQSYDLLHTCRRLGTYYHPSTAHLFDGTQWSFGSPILNTERVAEIEAHHDPSSLAVVNVRLRY